MVGEDKVIMSVKEVRRLPVIQQAGAVLGVTDRQVRTSTA